jgi:dethiobiotin synthetase
LNGLFITGTDTGSGKTSVAVSICQAMKQFGLHLHPRKPVESGCLSTAGKLFPEDAWKLQQASQTSDPLEVICSYRFQAALAPDRAARLEGQTILCQQLQDACTAHIKPSNWVIVEGAGGFYSPLAEDGLNADLAMALSLPVILVVKNTLGCINQTLLTLEAIKHRNLTLAAIILNDSQPQEKKDMDNLSDIQRHLTNNTLCLRHYYEKPEKNRDIINTQFLPTLFTDYSQKAT